MGSLSQDPFVNMQAARQEQLAYEDGVKQGIKLAAEKVRRTGMGLWDHIASIIEAKE